MCAIYKKNKKLYGKKLCKEYKNYLLKIKKRKKYDLAWKMISIINKCLKEEYQTKLQLIFFIILKSQLKIAIIFLHHCLWLIVRNLSGKFH